MLKTSFTRFLVVALGLLAGACGPDATPERDGAPSAATAEQPIYGGTATSPAGTGVVLIKMASGAICSGVIIANDWVLTAAHCPVIEGVSTVQLGGDVVTVRKAFIHHSYQLFNPEPRKWASVYDLQMLRLSAPLPSPDGKLFGFRQPVSQGTNTWYQAPVRCLGYGANHAGYGGSLPTYSGGGELRRGDMHASFGYPPDFVTTGGESLLLLTATVAYGPLPLGGDSGGPCFDTQGRLAGIIASGHLQPSALGSTYEWVPDYGYMIRAEVATDWMNAIMADPVQGRVFPRPTGQVVVGVVREKYPTEPVGVFVKFDDASPAPPFRYSFTLRGQHGLRGSTIEGFNSIGAGLRTDAHAASLSLLEGALADGRSHTIHVFTHDVAGNRYVPLPGSGSFVCGTKRVISPDYAPSTALLDVPCESVVVRDLNEGRDYVSIGQGVIPVTNLATWQAAGYRSGPQPVFGMELAGLHRTPVDRTLLRDVTSGELYLVLTGARFKMTEASLGAMGVDLASARPVPTEGVAAIPAVPRVQDLEAAPYMRDGTTVGAVRPDGTACNYLMLGGAKLLLPGSPLACFPGHGADGAFASGDAESQALSGEERTAAAAGSPTVTLPEALVAHISDVPRDGYLLREASEPAARLGHLTQGGGKLPIASAQVLEALGLPTQPTVYTVADGALGHLPLRHVYGRVQRQSEGVLEGWALDVSAPAAAARVWLNVDVEGGSPTLEVAANSHTLNDINTLFGVTGAHGFRVSVPAGYRTGQERALYTRALPAPGGAAGPGLTLQPRPLRVTLSPMAARLEGQRLDGKVFGWALHYTDPRQPLLSMRVNARPSGTSGKQQCLYSDNVQATWTSRPDIAQERGVAAAYGFEFSLPTECLAAMESWLDVFVHPPTGKVPNSLGVSLPLTPPAPDRTLAGDFLGLGHAQLLLANGSGSGAKFQLQDCRAGQTPCPVVREVAWEQARQQDSGRPALGEFFDKEDHWLVGDFLGRGYAQLLLVNIDFHGWRRDALRMAVVDFRQGAQPQVAFTLPADWARLDGNRIGIGSALRTPEHALGGDFLGRGYSQLLVIERYPDDAGATSPSRVFDIKRLAAHLTDGAPLSEAYTSETWLNSSFLSPDDRLVVGNLLGTGRAVVGLVNTNPASASEPRLHLYKVLEGTFQEIPADGLAGWVDADDLTWTGDFLGRGHDQMLFVNRSGTGGKLFVADFAQWGAHGWVGWDDAHLNGLLDAADRHAVGRFMAGRSGVQVAHLETLQEEKPDATRLAFTSYQSGPRLESRQVGWGGLQDFSQPPARAWKEELTLVPPLAFHPTAQAPGHGAVRTTSWALSSGWVAQERDEAVVMGHPARGTFLVEDALHARYAQLGYQASFLGHPTSDPQSVSLGSAPYPMDGVPGVFSDFEGGAIYWSPKTPAVEMPAPILAKWRGELMHTWGYPTGSGDSKGGGRYTHFDSKGASGLYAQFEGGSILWHPSTGAQAVQGAIRDAYHQAGWEYGPLGYPTTGELRVLGDEAGRHHAFQGGSIYWHPDTGAHPIYAPVREAWRQRGATSASGPGYPIAGGFTGAKEAPTGYSAFFQRGCLFSTPAVGGGAPRFIGSQWVCSRYRTLGGPGGRLGYPLADEERWDEFYPGRYKSVVRTQGASLWYTPAAGGPWAVWRGPVHDAWEANHLAYGFATADVRTDWEGCAGCQEGRFEYAIIRYTPQQGITVTPITPPDPDDGPEDPCGGVRRGGDGDALQPQCDL